MLLTLRLLLRGLRIPTVHIDSRFLLASQLVGSLPPQRRLSLFRVCHLFRWRRAVSICLDRFLQDFARHVLRQRIRKLYARVDPLDFRTASR